MDQKCPSCCVLTQHREEGSAEIFIRHQSHSWDLHPHDVNSPKAPPANFTLGSGVQHVCAWGAHTVSPSCSAAGPPKYTLHIVDCLHFFLRALKALAHLPKIRVSSDVSEPWGKIYTEVNLSSALSLGNQESYWLPKCRGGAGLGWCICLQKDKSGKEKQQQYSVWFKKKKKKPKPNKHSDTSDSCDSL